MQYVINEETKEILKGSNLGRNYRKPPYRPATQQEIDDCDIKELRDSKIEICKTYLTSKDWLAIRSIDVPGSYPQSVKDARTAARLAINDIEKLTTPEEVEGYDISKFE